MAMYLAVGPAQRTTDGRALASVAPAGHWADACADQLPARQAQDAVVPGCLLPGEPVGEIRGVAGAESGRRASGTLADVAAVWQAGYHERDH
jgi:hypothetical protein